MSSLAAARADNFYYGPDYRREHGSLNKYRKSNPLGVRAKKSGEGILVIRFEMPYKVFCLKCKEVIAKGVRFNAEKKCVGMYHTTKILEFSMKCCFCDNILKIETDPKNCDYVVTQGLHRKVETFKADDAQTLEFRSIEERDKIENDPMLKLETVTEDINKAVTKHSQLQELIELKESRDAAERYYDLNCEMRQKFRLRKLEETAAKKFERRPKNFAVQLLPPSARDIKESQGVKFLSDPRKLTKRIKDMEKQRSSIFATPRQGSFASTPDPHFRRDMSQDTSLNEAEESCVPDPVHPSLSIIIKPKAQPLCTDIIESPKARKLRLRKEFQRLKIERLHALKAAR